MNLEQARVKLSSVKQFTVGRSANDMIMFAELCDIVRFLLDEIERVDVTRRKCRL